MSRVRPIFSAVFVTNTGFGVFFAILMILIVTTYSTSWQEEIWWLSYADAPSLIGSLVFTVLLLFWWSLACWVAAVVAGEPPHATEKLMLVGVHLLQIALAAVLWVAWDMAELESYERYGVIPRDENYLERRARDRGPIWALGVKSVTWLKVEFKAYGVWRVNFGSIESAQDTMGVEADKLGYLAFWHNGRYQYLDAQFGVLADGRYRFFAGEDWSTRPESMTGYVMYLYGDDGSFYRANVVQGPEFVQAAGAGVSFELEFDFTITMIDGIPQEHDLSEPLALSLSDRKLVYSSHPVPLRADYPFYDESRRVEAPGYRVNPDALYP